MGGAPGSSWRPRSPRSSRSSSSHGTERAGSDRRSNGDVLSVKLLEALLVATVAASAGLALAYLWVFPLEAPGLRATLAGWSVLYPATHLTPVVDLTELLSLALAVVAPFVGLSIVPAWRADRKSVV